MRYNWAVAKKARHWKLRSAVIFALAACFSAWILALCGDDRVWFVAIADAAVSGLIVPVAVGLALVAGFMRRWLDLAVVVVGAFGFIAVSGQLRLSPTLASAATGRPLRIMSFNVEHGWQGVDRVAATIKQEKPDSFCLQEFGMGTDRKNVETLRSLLPEYHLFSDDCRTIGTRLRVVSEHSIMLTANRYSWTMVEQVVLVHGRQVRVLNVHSPSYLPSATLKRPMLDWLRRFAEVGKQQRDLIDSELSYVSRDPRPTVLCGDFNMTPVGQKYAKLAQFGKDAFAYAGSGVGWTAPALLPIRRIDYIWGFHGAEPTSSHVTNLLASDHAATVATLAIP